MEKSIVTAYVSEPLSKIKRDNIVRKVTNKKFETQGQKIKEQQTQLAHLIVDDILPTKFKTALQTLTADEDWFPGTRNLLVYKADPFVTMFEFTFGTVFSIPNNLLNYNGLRYHFENLSPKMQERVTKFKKKNQELLDAKNKLRTELRKIVNSVNTTKQLIEIFPEVTKWYRFEKKTDKQKYYPPAVQIDSLLRILKDDHTHLL